MTRQEMKSCTFDDLQKMFLSGVIKTEEDKMWHQFFNYPILIDNKEKCRYEITEYMFQFSKMETLIKEPSRWFRYIDNLFDKYNIVEVLTDLDDTMEDFEYNSFAGKQHMKVPSCTKLSKKYFGKTVVPNGYHGLTIRENPNPIPWEDQV